MADLQAPDRPGIGIGTDHAGLEMKNRIADHLRAAGYEVTDFGAHTAEPCDYPDIAITIAQAVAAGKVSRGILVCGSGIGMSIAANKVRGIRAALCTQAEAARLSREHNDANVLVLAGRDGTAADPLELVDLWLKTPFSGEERHARRIAKITAFDEARG